MTTTEVAVASELQPVTSKDISYSRDIDVEMATDLISMESTQLEQNSSSKLAEDMDNQRHSMDGRLSGFQCLQPQPRQPPVLGSPNPASSWRPMAPSQSQSGLWGLAATGGEIPLSSVKPGPVYPMEEQLKTARTYGIRLEDGTLVPLYRGDELDSLNLAMIQCQAGPENMIILPPLQLPRSNNCVATGEVEQMVPSAVSTLNYIHCHILMYIACQLSAKWPGKPP